MPFDNNTTAGEAANAFSGEIKGKNIIVTGVSPNSIGLAFAKAVAKHEPGLLVVTGRSAEKLQKVVDDIKSVAPNVNIRTLQFDLASLKSVQAAANEVLSWGESIDVLVNNAGIMGHLYSTTVDGHELQFGTDHLGPFLFTQQIMPKLLSSKKQPRVVNISSEAHRIGGVLADPTFEKGAKYDRWVSYAQAKSANALYAKALADRYGSQGLRAFSVHPGMIYSGLFDIFTPDDLQIFVKMGAMTPEGKPNLECGKWKSLEAGASTHVVAAFDPSIADKSGSYLQDCQVDPSVAPHASSKEEADRLFDLSEQMVGLRGR